MEKKYKYITIKRTDDEMFNRRPIYRIYNNKSGGELGGLFYYKLWKTYVFSSAENCVFNDSCLKDILDFIENIIPQGGGNTP